MSTISPQARQELVTAVAERYQRSTPDERGRVLDEFVALTGYHRVPPQARHPSPERKLGNCRQHGGDAGLCTTRP